MIPGFGKVTGNFLSAFALLAAVGSTGARAAGAGAAGAGAAGAASFQKTTAHSLYLGEGVDAGDFNKDGAADVVNGPYWFQGPGYKTRHLYAPVAPVGRDVSLGWEMGPANAPWGNHVADFNGDGWDDIMIFERLESTVWWYENPKGGTGMWKRHAGRSAIGHESRHIGDIQGDSRPEFIGASKDSLGWFEPDWASPASTWKFHGMGKGDFEFGHGLGMGDVNGDGRKDALCATGWFEQPASAATRPWPFHAQSFKSEVPAPRVSPALNGGSHMHAYDVDGDGLNDVVTALNAHGWGLAWFRQVKGSDGKTSFVRNVIMGDSTEKAEYGAAFSQLHSVGLADVDGDGLKDIVTGKTWWAHPPEWGDPDGTGTPVLYLFKLIRENGTARFQPQLLDDKSGVGRHILIKDVNGDGRPDIVTGNKSGLYVFTQVPSSNLIIRPAEAAGSAASRAALRMTLRMNRGLGIGGLSVIVLDPMAGGQATNILGARLPFMPESEGGAK